MPIAFDTQLEAKSVISFLGRPPNMLDLFNANLCCLHLMPVG